MELLVPVYLNQTLVFDLVAMMRGGIATVTKVTESRSHIDESVTEASGAFGLSEAFSSLLKINMSGGIADSTEATTSTDSSEERIHTPASLFFELRNLLIEKKKVNFMLEGLPRPGEFIEFQASLNRNPLIIGLDALIQLLVLSDIFTKDKKEGKKTGQKNKPSELRVLTDQFQILSDSLKEGGSRDLVAKISDGKVNAVLTVEEQFLNDKTMSDIADGTFRVLGKVVRSFEDPEQSINLLRKTPLAHSPHVISEFQTMFENLDKGMFAMPKMEPHVNGPAIQVLPVAIYS